MDLLKKIEKTSPTEYAFENLWTCDTLYLFKLYYNKFMTSLANRNRPPIHNEKEKSFNFPRFMLEAI